MVDQIIQGKTRSRRQFCSFYTESDPILTYMVNRLSIQKDDYILEPCAGDGIFIEKILSLYDKLRIDALDLNPEAISGLKNKFNNNEVNIRQADTLLDKFLDTMVYNGGSYTKVIGNPPYGAWQEFKKRDLLKEKYGGYVKETYTLFIRRCIDMLKEGGKLVFIVPDTFLALHLHRDTRLKILENTKIEEILLIPSKFFPGVNFGYSNLCIITLLKTKDIKDNAIKIVSIRDSVENLYELTRNNYSVASNLEVVKQEQILNSVDYSFFIGGDNKIRRLINESHIKLSDIADCVTGFYSGDNKKFIVAKDSLVKGSKGYKVVDHTLVETEFLKKRDILKGLQGRKIYIPYLKGGNGILKKETEWYLQWSNDNVEFYKSNKASRFQNSQFYFKEGIGVPMVKSSKINAFLLENRLFDQSIVGIFPHDKKHLNYLLAFLNSEACNKLLKVINHTANNSANYLKKLPIILDEAAISEIDNLMNDFNHSRRKELTIEKINNIFSALYDM